MEIPDSDDFFNEAIATASQSDQKSKRSSDTPPSQSKWQPEPTSISVSPDIRLQNEVDFLIVWVAEQVAAFS